MKIKLIKLALNKEFYDKNSHLIEPTMFEDFMAYFYQAILFAHQKYKRTINLDELEQIILMNNPTMSEAQKELIEQIMVRIKAEPEIGPDVATDVLRSAWREETGRRISKIGLDIIEGKSSLEDVSSIIARAGDSFIPDDGLVPITTDVDDVLSALDKRIAWKFNLPSLATVVPGISGGEFTIIFARPEVGKTASWVSFVCGPEGFAWQGANVHIIVNEEPAIRTMLRCISSASGLTRDEIKANPGKAKLEWNKIRQNISIVDDVDMNMDRLNAYAKKNRPDILILDQLDKVSVSGAFARKDEMLGETYQRAREIGKRWDCSVVGLTQASADAEGKTKLHYSMMAESKTSKAAEADLIIGVGRQFEKLEDPLRFFTLSKNKISGRHATVHGMLSEQISRLVA